MSASAIEIDCAFPRDRAVGELTALWLEWGGPRLIEEPIALPFTGVRRYLLRAKVREGEMAAIDVRDTTDGCAVRVQPNESFDGALVLGKSRWGEATLAGDTNPFLERFCAAYVERLQALAPAPQPAPSVALGRTPDPDVMNAITREGGERDAEIVKRWWEGQTAEEIGTQIGREARTVQNLISRLRKTYPAIPHHRQQRSESPKPVHPGT
ncbi:MAG: hypothetical protein GEU73_07970 [Chloroflexi bacterium]|nr:hypothetical protein [Chloroflexota bacterium]